MGFQKLGSPYKNKTNTNTKSSNNKNKTKQHTQGQSYMWKVDVYKKKLIGKPTFIVSKVFTNKVEAMKFYHDNYVKPYYAVIKKWDPTKR